MKKVFALLLAAVMLLSLGGCAQKEPAESTPGGMKRITVTVVHSDGTSKEFTYETEEEFLGPVLQQDGLIEGNAGPYGLEITKVDGEQAIYDKDKAYWSLYEGTEYALQGVDSTPVTDGGTYRLEYTRA